MPQKSLLIMTPIKPSSMTLHTEGITTGCSHGWSKIQVKSGVDRQHFQAKEADI
jgi:hypothetical protein